MVRLRIATVAGLAAFGLVVPAVASGSPALAASRSPALLLHVGQIDEQDVPALGGSEPDTLAEPDVAVSPRNPLVAVAAAHDGRFADAGAVAISYAWTHDGGRTWHHAPVPQLTVPFGGAWQRVSDPVVAWGPDGSVYISTLLLGLGCDDGIAVSRSTDGGQTFAPPTLADSNTSCTVSDDKNWLVVDNGPFSPHRGRLYQFFTPFLSDDQGNPAGNPQVVRWSDDQGRTWAPMVPVSAPDADTQDSQPMIRPDGTVVDTYLHFLPGQGGDEGPEHPEVVGRTPPAVPAAGDDEEEGTPFVAVTSRDGGRTWSAETTITDEVGDGPPNIRCCLPAAAADPVTGRLYAAWDSVDPAEVSLSTSADGTHWSEPVRVNTDTTPGRDHVNVRVTAFANRVYVAYGTRDTTVQNGRFVQEQVSVSPDAGRRFGAPVSVGPLSDLRFAALSRGVFPGDYTGASAADGFLYLVWAQSSTPPDPAAQFHQVLFGATLIA